MALNPSKLAANIAAMGYGNTVAQGAANMASAYASYAADAQTASGDSCLTIAVGKSMMQAALSMLVPSGTSAPGAAVFAQAFVAFWAGALFGINGLPSAGIGGDGIFSKVLTAVVVTVVPQPLQANLAGLPFAPDTATGASNIAAALHAATTTQVAVLISGLDTTLPTPVPITNLGSLT